MLKTLASACVLAVLSFTSTTAHAQTFDNRTFFTFNQPITLPGVTLPAGKYLFRNPDINTSRRVVQVLSDDGEQSYAMLLTIPVERTEPAAEPEIRFMETAEGTPAAIKAWWYPGNTIGWEFIYPREQALKLAKRASGSVLTTTSAELSQLLRVRPDLAADLMQDLLDQQRRITLRVEALLSADTGERVLLIPDAHKTTVTLS